MKNQHVEHLFIDALEALLTDEQKAHFDKHLKECPTCAREFNSMQAVYTQTREAAPPQQEESFWNKYWYNLQYKLDAPGRRFYFLSKLSRLTIDHYLRAGLAAAALIILSIGLYFGELSFHISDVTDTPMAHINTIQDKASTYLERSKILLTSISNIETKESPRIHNFERQKALSQTLVDQTAQLQQELDPVAQKRMLSLVNDLETVLLQIANLDSAYDTNTLEMIQYSVEQKSILFKLNLQDITNIKSENIKGEDI